MCAKTFGNVALYVTAVHPHRCEVVSRAVQPRLY